MTYETEAAKNATQITVAFIEANRDASFALKSKTDVSEFFETIYKTILRNTYDDPSEDE